MTAASQQPTAAHRTLSREAAGLCADPLFRVFLKEDCGMFAIDTAMDAIIAIRLLCRVACLSQFDRPDSDAAANWQNLLRRYQLWMEPPSVNKGRSRKQNIRCRPPASCARE